MKIVSFVYLSEWKTI